MGIHQGEHYRVEHREHLGHWREADSTVILAQSDIPPPVEPILHPPMVTRELQELLRRTALAWQARPAIDHLDAVLVFGGAFPLQTKHLAHLAPVACQIVIEIRTGGDVTPFLTAMAFLDLLKGLPGASIRLGVFKKQFQICSGDWRIVFNEQHHVASGSLHEPPKVMIALRGIGGENSSFAYHLGQQGFEGADFIVLAGDGTLLQDHARLHFIDMQHLLLWGFSPIDLFARPSQDFAVDRQVGAALAGLVH